MSVWCFVKGPLQVTVGLLVCGLVLCDCYLCVTFLYLLLGATCVVSPLCSLGEGRIRGKGVFVAEGAGLWLLQSMSCGVQAP